MLYRCNAFQKTADAYLDQLSLRNLDATGIEAHRQLDAASEFEFALMPPPIFAINATKIVVNRGVSPAEPGLRDKAGNLTSELDAVNAVCIDGDVCLQIPDLRYSLVNTTCLHRSVSRAAAWTAHVLHGCGHVVRRLHLRGNVDWRAVVSRGRRGGSDHADIQDPGGTQ